MHIPFFVFKAKSSYVLLEYLSAAISLASLAAVSLDWNQIIMGVIGLISAYIAFKSHALTKKVEVVSTTLETTKKEINSQMTEALKVTLEKGVLDGMAKERARRDTEISDKAKGAKEATKLEVDLKIPTEIKDKMGLP